MEAIGQKKIKLVKRLYYITSFSYLVLLIFLSMILGFTITLAIKKLVIGFKEFSFWGSNAFSSAIAFFFLMLSIFGYFSGRLSALQDRFIKRRAQLTDEEYANIMSQTVGQIRLEELKATEPIYLNFFKKARVVCLIIWALLLYFDAHSYWGFIEEGIVYSPYWAISKRKYKWEDVESYFRDIGYKSKKTKKVILYKQSKYYMLRLKDGTRLGWWHSGKTGEKEKFISRKTGLFPQDAIKGVNYK